MPFRYRVKRSVLFSCFDGPASRIVSASPQAAHYFFGRRFEKLTEARVTNMRKLGGPTAAKFALTALNGSAPDAVPTGGMLVGGPSAAHDRGAVRAAQGPTAVGGFTRSEERRVG